MTTVNYFSLETSELTNKLFQCLRTQGKRGFQTRLAKFFVSRQLSQVVAILPTFVG